MYRRFSLEWTVSQQHTKLGCGPKQIHEYSKAVLHRGETHWKNRNDLQADQQKKVKAM